MASAPGPAPRVSASQVATVSSPTRLAILLALRERRATMSELSRRLAMSRQVVSRHLDLLEEAGFLRREPTPYPWSYVSLTSLARHLLSEPSALVLLSLEEPPRAAQ